jgi:enamine deaminase RidA (YjgF/YER057c/UK114 family)
VILDSGDGACRTPARDRPRRRFADFDRDYATMNARYASHFAADRLPARTTVGVTRLARGGLVEIDLVAARR